jgi:hypothetical protein
LLRIFGKSLLVPFFCGLNYGVLAFVEIKCNLRNKRETLHTSEEFSFSTIGNTPFWK